MLEEEGSRPVTELLTIDETAALLKLSDRTIYEMFRGGRLPGAAKVSGKWRIDRDKLLAWIARGGELANETK
jgi:excisionase family DNA binding protein